MTDYSDGLPIGVSFIVKNITSPPGRIIKVFNTQVYPGQTLDVMRVLGIGETEVRDSLLKGDLGKKIKNRQLMVVSSTLVLPESDAAYISFLNSSGLNANIINNTTGLFGTSNASALTQSTWYIDPANSSGFASNANDGYTATTPLLTFSELNKRWKQASIVNNYTNFLKLTQDTSVIYLSVPADPYQDSVNLDVDRLGSFNLSFTYVPPTAHSGTITAVTPRGATQWWQVTGSLSNSDVHSLIVNTTKGSSAWVLAQTAGVADTTEWVTKATGAIKNLAPPSLITPVTNDSFSVKTLGRIHLGHINLQPTSNSNGTLHVSAVSFVNFQFAADATSGAGFPDAVQINGLNGALGAGASWLGVTFTECLFEGKANITNVFCTFYNSFALDYITFLTGQGVFLGGGYNGLGGNASYMFIDAYTTFFGSSAVSDEDFPAPSLMELCSIMLYNTQDAFFGTLKGSRFNLLPSFYNSGHSEIVGRTSRYLFRMSNGSTVMLHPSSGNWTNFLKASTPQFAAVDGGLISAFTAVSFNQSTMALGSTPIVVTPAALDATIGSGGFGGWAVHPGTGTAFRTYNE